jgi:hypothetical protein
MCWNTLNGMDASGHTFSPASSSSLKPTSVDLDGIPGGLNHFLPSQYERPLLRSTSPRNSEKELAICSQ